MTRRLALVTILFVLFVPWRTATAQEGTDTPVWLFTSCNLENRTGTATLAWFSPPQDVLPFTSRFPGILWILAEGYGEADILTYTDASPCPLYPGCVFYRWRSVYDLPPDDKDDYYLSAEIVNSMGEVFSPVPSTFRPGCLSGDRKKMYLPALFK